MLQLLSDRKVGRGIVDVSKHLQSVGCGLYVGIEDEKSEIILSQQLFYSISADCR